ncbi:PTS transporter subunit EIIC [Brenneria goodwinii]|uniref:PTS transporter subunit EIIC n=1 Tax=Brenneria goodwinii TaxID=1109412 RepID=UPI0036EE6320
MDYHLLARKILSLVGGRGNVNGLVHCATRLRFSLVNDSMADANEIKNLEGVLSVIVSGGQFQVILGNHVSHVYKEMIKDLDTDSALDTGNISKNDTKKKSISNIIFETISGSFSPLIPAMAGSAMVKAMLEIMVSLNLIDSSGGTYHVLSAASSAIFYFFPILLGASMSSKLGANIYVGGAIGAALLEPNYVSLIGSSTNILGFTIIPISYASSVFPIMITVVIYAQLDKVLKRICPNSIQLFMVPMLSLIITVPFAILFFGPFGTYLSNHLVSFVSYLSVSSGMLTGAIFGGLILFVVILGLHWGFVPLAIANIAAGGDPLSAVWAPATFAQMGIALGILLKSRDVTIKSIAGPGVITGLLAGVTEPIIYGLILKYKKTLPYAIISGSIGGAINGYFNVKMLAFAPHSILALPIYVPTGRYIIGIAAGFLLGTFLTYFIGYEDKLKN